MWKKTKSNYLTLAFLRANISKTVTTLFFYLAQCKNHPILYQRLQWIEHAIQFSSLAGFCCGMDFFLLLHVSCWEPAWQPKLSNKSQGSDSLKALTSEEQQGATLPAVPQPSLAVPLFPGTSPVLQSKNRHPKIGWRGRRGIWAAHAGSSNR